jgi:RNA polymerase sigma factor (sigma-70 family)
VRNDPTVVLLVTRARDGDKAAWDGIVERYAPLVWSICRRFRLSPADIDDVGQSVWLRLIEHLPGIVEPAALPGWIATTTQRECLTLLRGMRRSEPIDPLDRQDIADPAVQVEEELLIHERRAIARAAFDQLPPRCQLLLSMLAREPRVPYSEISRSLHIPVGSIGPNRARCLDKLRRTPALAALLDADHGDVAQAAGGESHGRPVVER